MEVLIWQEFALALLEPVGALLALTLTTGTAAQVALSPDKPSMRLRFWSGQCLFRQEL